MTKLTSILTSLSQGSTESVQSGYSFGDLDKYLHIKRSIEDSLCAKMDSINSEGGGLILLVGSAGDGKSHLISSVRNKPQYADFKFYNDATESYSPTKTAIDTLREVLVDFSDESLGSTNKKLVLAINIGKLNAFFEDDSVRTKYSKLIKFVEALFSEEDKQVVDSDRLKMVQFTNLQIFEFDKDSTEDYPVDSSFLKEFLRRITLKDLNNPFYVAYLESVPKLATVTDPVVLNYQLLCLPSIQDSIVKLIIEAIIRFKLMVTPREFQDFIYTILVYEDLESYTDDKCFIESLLPTMLYNGNRSKIQRHLSMLDPLKYSSTKHDQDLAELFTSSSIPQDFLNETILDEFTPTLLDKLRLMCGNNRKNIMRTTQFLFRLKHVLAYHSESQEYKTFLRALKGFINKDGQEVQRIYQMVDTVIPRHYGSYYCPEKTVPLNIQGSRHRLFASINIVPDNFYTVYSSPNEFSLTLNLKWRVQGDSVNLPIDYQLYEYLTQLNNGKLSLNFESNKNMSFSHFIRQLVSLSDSSQEVIIMTSDNQKFKLSSQFGVINYRQC